MNRSTMRRSNRGFSLTELMIVIFIMALIMGMAIPAYQHAMQKGRITSVTGAVTACKTACASYLSKPGGLGIIPLSEGTIPAGQVTAPATAATAAAAGSLDQILLTEGLLENPLSLKMGPQISSVTGTQVTWAPATNTWGATALPTANKATIARLESQLSTATSPDTAAGSNFRLDGINSLPTNVRVCSLVIPSVPADDAYNLSLSLDGTGSSPANNGLADSLGKVAYDAPVAGVTTVYVYVFHY